MIIVILFDYGLTYKFPGVWFSWIIDDLIDLSRASEVSRVDGPIKVQGGECGMAVNEDNLAGLFVCARQHTRLASCSDCIFQADLWNHGR